MCPQVETLFSAHKLGLQLGLVLNIRSLRILLKTARLWSTDFVQSIPLRVLLYECVNK